GCSNSDELEVMVHALPQVMAGDTSYCNSEGAYALPYATPEGGVWTGPGIAGMTFDPVAAGGVGMYQASYVYTDANGCTDSAVVTLEVVEPAMVWAGPDTLLCASETAYDLSLQASPSGGVWLTTSGGLTGSVFDASAAGVGMHLLEYRYGEGSCEVRDTVWIEVVGLPVVDAGADVAVCESEEEVALSGTPAGGTWTASGGVLSGSSFYPAASGAGTYVLTYSYTDSLGCSNSDALEVTVHALPQVVAGDTVFCNTPGPLGLPDAFPAGGIWTGPGVEDNAFHPDEAGGVGTYTLVYTYSDAFGCTDSTQATVEVIELPEVEAGPDDTICGNAGLYHLQDFSPAGGTWSGPGIVDGNQGIFDPLVAGGGLIEVAYTYGAGNCEVTDTRMLFVVLPDVQAGTAETHCLAEGPVVLSGASPAGGYWTGPGIVDSLAGVFDPAAAGVGAHEVTYVFKDTLTGCTFFPSKQVTVHPMPQSQFAMPAEACADAAIAFQNQSASTWQVLWDFGDGTTSSTVDPTHAYDEEGWYTVTLHTTNEFGCMDSIAQQIYVATAPALAFEPDVHEGCAVLEVDFTNNSSGYQTSWLWDFGNGLTDTTFQPGPVLYDQGTADTTYVVTLTGTNLCASVQLSDTITVFPRPTAIFGTSIDSTCSPAVVAFANVSTGLPQAFFWDFGNGFTSTDSVPGSQTYYADSLYQTYTISLVAINDCGADTATHEIVVAPPGVDAFFNIPTETGCQPFELAFTNYATPGATVYWDFGDGNTSSLTNPVHVFEEPGTFTVVQYATTGCGYDSTTAVVHVLPAPEVSFTHLPEVCQGDSVQFLNTSPSPLAGTQWYFGDGDSSLLGAPWHVFDTAGIYTVTLVGTSSVNGCRAEAQGTIEIRPLPQIALAPDPPYGCAPLTVQFDNLSAGADFFVWHFGDGNTATQQAPTHTYQQPGNYAVVLEGRDAFGCTDTAEFEYVHVFPVPQAGFEMERDRLCGYPVQVQMVNTSQGAEGFFWLLGDGTQSALNAPM
ncbi:MAG: PKD domain-containing protein, partial [Caldilineae bacterium]